MSHHGFCIKYRPLGLVSLFLLLASCASLSKNGEFQTPGLKLTLTLSKAQYDWGGEPVIARLTLANTTPALMTVPMLDQASVAFTVAPQSKENPAELHFVEPVSSPKLQTGAPLTLGPAGTPQSVYTRDFVFTTLSFNRGGYVLAAVYTQPNESPVRPAKKSYAKATAFTIAGEHPAAHRYKNGLISREDAIALASAAGGGKPQNADTLLIIDEAGFNKWWVNLTLAGGQGATVKSYFIDPYFAKVWKEARPFTAEDKGVDPVLPQDAKILQQLREKTDKKRAQ